MTQKWASHLCAPQVPLPSWIRSSGPPILLGLYCGFAATLPTGPFHVPSVRASVSGREGVSGRSVASSSVTGQPVIIPSAYSPHFHVVSVKPHAVTSPAPPFISLCWYRHRRVGIEASRTAEPRRGAVTAIGWAYAAVASRDTEVWVRRSTLLDIIILPLPHHVPALSPALARLVRLFVSRHSNQFLFVISSLRGWSGGSIPLEHSATPLVVPKINPADDGPSEPVEPPAEASTTHRVPGTIVTALRLLPLLGRAPLPVPFRETRHEPQRSDGGGDQENFSWLHAWPASAFYYQKGVRPFRYVTDSYNPVSPVKKELSQYHFCTVVGPRKQTLSLSSPPGLSIPDDNSDKSVNLSLLPTTRKEPPPCREWIRTGGRKESDSNNDSINRTEAPREGYSLVRVVDSNNGLYDHGESVPAEIHDPSISNGSRGRIVGFRSTRLSTCHRSGRWTASNSFRNSPGASAGKGRNTGNHHREHPLLFVDATRRNSYSSLVTRVLRTHDMIRLSCVIEHKQKCRWILNLVNDLLSVGSSNNANYAHAAAVGYIRSMKVRNVEYAVNDRTGNYRVLKRPVLQPDYRRNLVAGLMRARRRKTLVWESLQSRTHSPLFLRMIGNSAPPQFAPGINAKVILTPHRCSAAGEEDNKANPFFRRSTKTATARRIATAKRWDSTTAHLIRGCSPIAQLYLRRNVILPTLIIFKNICYLIMFQKGEWGEDWNELNKEVYVGRSYDGNAAGVANGLPRRWYRNGLQIKIVNPFYMRHRRHFVYGQSEPDDGTGINSTGGTRNGMSTSISSYETNSYGNSSSAGGGMGFGHSTALGCLAESPPGDRIKRPSFWKPFLMELGRVWWENVPWIRKTHIENLPSRPAGKDPSPVGKADGLDAGTGKSIGDRVAGTRPGECGAHSARIGGISDLSIEFMSERDCPLAVSDQSEYRARMSTGELGCLVARGNDGASRVTGEFAGTGKAIAPFGPTSQDRGYTCGSGTGRPILIHRIVVRARGRCLRLLRVSTCFVQIPFSGFHGAAAPICRSLPVWFNIRLITRSTRRYVSKVRYAIMHLGLSQSRPGTGKNSLMRARDLLAGRGGGDSIGGVDSSRRDARVISQAYVLSRAWRLSAVNKCRPPDPEYRRGNPGARESTAHFGGQGILGKRSLRALGRRYEWSRDPRRYNVPSGIWCRIAPRGRKMKDEYPRMKDRDLNNSRDKEQSMTLDEAICLRGIDPKPTAGVGRSRKIDRQYGSNPPSKSYPDVVPDSSDIRGFAKPWRMGRGIIPNDRTQKHRERIVSGGEWDRPENKMNERKNLPFGSNIHSWLYIDIPERFHILEMPEFATTRYLGLAREPNVSTPSGYACAGRGSARGVETEFREDRIEGRWDLGSEQVTVRARKMRDAANVPHAVFIGYNIEYPREGSVESTRESMSRDMAPPPYHAAPPDSTNGMLDGNWGHRAVGVDKRFLKHKMLSVLPNSQNRFRGILDFIAYYDKSVPPRTGIIEDGGDKTICPHSSHIGDVPLPKHRVGSRILESFYLAEGRSRGARSEGGTVEGHKRRDEEPPVQNRNAEENETQTINSILRPGHRPEDLSRMNRPRFCTNNGSQFAAARVRIYPSTGIFMT